MTGFMRAWVATGGKSAGAWRQSLTPFEDASLRAGMAHADPSNVPAHKVTGPVKVNVLKSGQQATGLVATDAGTMFVSAVADGRTWWVVDVEPAPKPSHKATAKPSHKATAKPSHKATAKPSHKATAKSSHKPSHKR